MTLMTMMKLCSAVLSLVLAATAAMAQQWYEPDHPFLPPAFPQDQRSPSPLINSLANHGFIPRDGRNVNLHELSVHLEAIFHLDADFVFMAFVVPAIECGITMEETEGGHLLVNLADMYLCGDAYHSWMVHEPDPIGSGPQEALVHELLLNPDPFATTLTVQDMMNHQFDRILDVYNHTNGTLASDAASLAHNLLLPALVGASTPSAQGRAQSNAEI